MRRILPLFLVTVLALSSCTVEISQRSPTNPAPHAQNTIIPTSAPSGLVGSVAWGDLHPTGHLVYSRISSSDDVSALRVEILNLATGVTKQVFSVPDDGHIYYSAVSPDGNELILSYVPPPVPGAARTQALYRLAMDGGSQPELLFPPPTEDDEYLQVEWSPDGKYLYLVHVNRRDQPAGQIYPDYQILRMLYPDGQPELIVDHAFWPRVSPDSTRLAYVSLDPFSGANQLFLANADGTAPRLVPIDSPPEAGIVDAPFFTPDGSALIFSAPNPEQSYQPGLLDRVLGVQIALAHSLPSDWWKVPLAGGQAEQLTRIHSTNLFGRMSPDGHYIVSSHIDGIFVMEPDGSSLTSILPASGATTVDWLP